MNKKEPKKIFDFPPKLSKADYNHVGYKGFMKEFYDTFLKDFSQKDCWEKVLSRIEKNNKLLESLLIYLTIPRPELENEIKLTNQIKSDMFRVYRIQIGYFSKIKLPEKVEIEELSKIQSYHVNPNPFLIRIKELFKIRTMYSKLYRVEAKEIPSFYLERFKKSIDKYMTIKGRFECGEYLL